MILWRIIKNNLPFTTKELDYSHESKVIKKIENLTGDDYFNKYHDLCLFPIRTSVGTKVISFSNLNILKDM